jgi:hypothetical protein
MVRALMFVAASFAALAGCLGASYVGNENSPYYLVPVGSRLTLHRALTIPGDQVAVFLQDGRLISSGGVRTLYPHCKFEVRRIATSARSVRPDEFIVTRVTQELVHSVDAGTLRYASALRTRGVSTDGDGPSLQAFATYLYLASDRQPDVFRLGCGQWGYMPRDRHVTIAEIRRTLGDVFTLRVDLRGG